MREMENKYDLTENLGLKICFLKHIDNGIKNKLNKASCQHRV